MIIYIYIIHAKSIILYKQFCKSILIIKYLKCKKEPLNNIIIYIYTNSISINEFEVIPHENKRN